ATARAARAPPAADGRAVPMDPARRRPVNRHVDRESLTVADRGGGHAIGLGETLAPPVWDSLQQRMRVAPLEWLDVPSARLVAVLVDPVGSALAVACRDACDHADRVIRHLSSHAGRPIPSVD